MIREGAPVTQMPPFTAGSYPLTGRAPGYL